MRPTKSKQISYRKSDIRENLLNLGDFYIPSEESVIVKFIENLFVLFCWHTFVLGLRKCHENELLLLRTFRKGSLGRVIIAVFFDDENHCHTISTVFFEGKLEYFGYLFSSKRSRRGREPMSRKRFHNHPITVKELV